MPHPPIVVPAVGGARTADCRATLDACRDAARRVVARAPDRLLVVSPHAPRLRGAFGVYTGARYRGDLGRFGARDAAVDRPTALDLATALTEVVPSEAVSSEAVSSKVEPIEVEPIEVEAIEVEAIDDPRFTDADHGAVVPLTFLAEAGWRGPTCIVSLPATPTPAACAAFGRRVAGVVDALDGHTAVLASGDMSHRVLPGAPAGHHPRAVEFDRQLTALIERGALDEIAALDPRLRELAAEDAADSALIGAAAAGFEARGTEVLSYEHPFGVGYLVAVLFDAG